MTFFDIFQLFKACQFPFQKETIPTINKEGESKAFVPFVNRFGSTMRTARTLDRKLQRLEIFLLTTKYLHSKLVSFPQCIQNPDCCCILIAVSQGLHEDTWHGTPYLRE